MGTSASAKSPISRHFVIVGIVVGVPVSAVFLALAARGLQPHNVVDSVHRAHVGDLLLAVACLGAMYACQALRWQRIAAAAGLRLGWRSFLRMVITGIAVNNAVPGRAGDAARV
ncbi:MAG: lysylphosphatidylglycerol synthase domain-containing protein, partial [Mycobacteriales bacterium]